MAVNIDRYKRIMADCKGALKDAWKKFIDQFQTIDNYQSQIEQVDRLVTLSELDSLLRNNVCEIVFVRRRPERAPDRPSIRRMLCTKSENIFNSINSRSLNFRRPKTSRRLNQQYHDICVVWDIFMQDYRNVSISTPEAPAIGPVSQPTCHLRQIIPDDDTFWAYFNNVLLKMTPQQKMNFMDS